MKLSLFFFLILTIKFSFAQPINYWGNTIKYNNYNNGLDKAISVTIDSHCYVYVTGESEGIGTGLDYLTIKFDINGDTVWTRRYDGGASGGDDIPAAIKVDNNGNVYVTGKSMGNGTGFDWETIKYDEKGTIVWQERFNNTKTGGNADDIAVKLFIDATGQNVTVGGYSYNYVSSNTSSDFLIIRYDASNGNSVWGNPNTSGYSAKMDFSYYDDVLADMVVDGSGNVYATGSSYNSNNQVREWNTLKIDNTGKWAGNIEAGTFSSGIRYPVSIALDGSDNVFVFGTMDDNLALVKYDSKLLSSSGLNYYGLQASGPYNYDNKATEMKYSSNYLYFTANLDYDGSAAVNHHIIVAKIDAVTLDTVWVKQYLGTGYDNGVNSFSLDATNNIYLTGYTTNSNGHKDFLIQKYTNAGKTVSGYPIIYNNGNSNFDHEGNQIVITPESNILVTGYSTGNTTQEDFITLKYVNFIPAANAGANQTGCSGNVVIGISPLNGYTYQWKPSLWLSDSTKSNPTVSDTLTNTLYADYFLTVRSGCAEDNDTVSVTINPLPPAPAIHISNTVILSNITSPVYSYQWYKDGTSMSGKVDTSLTSPVNGNYKLEITNSDGCSQISNTLTYVATGLSSIEALESFDLYPNPNKGEFQINFKNSLKDKYWVEIYNVLGQRVFSRELNSVKIQLKNISNGIYFMKLKNDNSEIVRQFVIQN